MYFEGKMNIRLDRSCRLPYVLIQTVHMRVLFTHLKGMGRASETQLKGVVNCQNSRDKGPPEGNSARG